MLTAVWRRSLQHRAFMVVALPGFEPGRITTPHFECGASTCFAREPEGPRPKGGGPLPAWYYVHGQRHDYTVGVSPSGT